MGPEIVFQHFEFKYELRSSEFKAQTIPFRFPDIFFNMHFKTTNSGDYKCMQDTKGKLLGTGKW